MTFDASIFWSAFSVVGLLTNAEYRPAGGPVVPFKVGFKRPDQIVLDGIVHSTDYSIEYQSADIALKRDDVVEILGAQYRVRQSPMAQGDGTFMLAQLEKVM
jgi:hypothetical protein